MEQLPKGTYLWEILVPVTSDQGQIPVSHHRIWDESVRAISGGLTILKTARGYWVSPSGDLFVETMIPVRIFCSEDEIDRVADLTAKHYDQEAVMYYRISDKVIIKHFS